jgi:alanyl-tRNA synthetase
MNRKQLIKKYIDFFKSKKHKEIPNVSLVPENDPTVLFTTAGMHPLVPYLLGQPHPLGKRLVNVQKCIRTGDIDQVGDLVHHTFFEMLGNWSLGDYWKEQAIEYSFEFLTKVLKIPKKRLAISVFGGDDDAPKDTEAREIWENLGIPRERIIDLTKEHNWWGPAGKTGSCGPDTEMFYWKLNNKPAPKEFDPNDENWVEIWNDVLMEYVKNKEGRIVEADQKNIDTGMGVERTVAILNGLEDNYLADMWFPIIKKIEKLSGKKYAFKKGDSGFEKMPDCWEKEMCAMRIIADHIKAAVFIIADGITPSNTEQGYVLRRLIRRAVRNFRNLGVDLKSIDSTTEVAKEVIKLYDDYKHLQKNKDKILNELKKEEDQFQRTLEKGLREFKKMSKSIKISGKDAFLLFQSYGFPLEMIEELANENGNEVDTKGFLKEQEKHQQLSRTATQGKFKSGLQDSSEQTTKLHTATHLLNQALRKVLKKPDLFQKGSNITPERLRFDFNFNRKLTDEEIKAVENLVNEKIQDDLPVWHEEMSLDKAKKINAQGVFEDRYKGKIKVYSIGNFSKEVCAGPHVSSTKVLGKFKIIKEESSAAGVRRIKAILENGGGKR